MVWEFNMLSTLAFVLAFTFVVKLIQLIWTRWKFQWALTAFPKHPREIFILGHAKAFTDGARGMLADWDDIYENDEKAMQVWLTPFNPGVVCYHPDSIKAVFSTAEPKDSSYRFFRNWLGDGLLLSTGSKWARNRRLLTPGLHFNILKPYVKVFVDSANVLAMKWKQLCIDDACSTDVMPYISLATLDSLMKCIMGVDENVQQLGLKHPYINANYILTAQCLLRFGSLLYQSDIFYAVSPDGFTQRKALPIAHEFTKKVITARKSHLQDSGDQISKKSLLPFLDILLQAKDEDGKGLSEQEIRNEVDTFMFEGHDTTSSALSWILYNLANNPELQERCRDEVDAVNEGIGDRQLEWTDLSQLVYLTQFIKESMRLHAPVPSVGRRLETPIRLPDGRVIPKGAGAYCHINGLHRNPNVWNDPLAFDPERFTAENVTKRSPFAFVPFAAGPRNCIGLHFAMAELKTTTAVLLGHFRFAVDAKNPVQRINQTVLRSTTGIHLTITLRD